MSFWGYTAPLPHNLRKVFQDNDLGLDLSVFKRFVRPLCGVPGRSLCQVGWLPCKTSPKRRHAAVGLAVDETAAVLERIEPWWWAQCVYPAQVEFFQLRQSCKGVGKGLDGIATQINLAKFTQVSDG